MEKSIGSKIKKHEDTSKGKRIKVICPQCKTTNQETNHEVLKSFLITGTEWWDEEQNCSMDWSDEFQIIQCNGCDKITFRELHWFSESQQGIKETLHPQRNANSFKIKHFPNLPFKIWTIYNETLNSFHTKSYILCAAGLRAIVESICTHQGIKDGSLEIEKPNGEKTFVRKNTLEGKIYGIYEKRNPGKRPRRYFA